MNISRVTASDDSPPDAAFLNGLGLRLIQQGRFEEAVARLREAIDRRPDFAEAHNNLGNALAHLGQFEPAVAAYRAAIDCQPGYAKAWSNLGSVLLRLGFLSDAEQACRRAVELNPNYAVAHNNLGNVLRRQERFDEAVASYRQALAVLPDYALAHNNLGIVLSELGRLAEAESQLRQALQIAPQLAPAHHALGNVLFHQDRFDEALASHEQALQFDPRFAPAWNGAGLALQYLGRGDEAVERFEHALRNGPDDELSCRNLAMALLQLGDLERGWPELERYRERTRQVEPPQPEWDGTPLGDRTLALWSERGLGDTMQFARYAALTQARRTILVCQPALMPLLATCTGVDEVRSRDDPFPECDVQASLSAIPAILRTTLESIPATTPYLFARDDLQAKWRPEIERVDGFKVGIVWQGNPDYGDDRRRSLPLDRFAPLSQVEGVQLISLQRGDGSEQLRQIDFPVIDLGSRLDEHTGAFEETAAVMIQLDLIVSSDTAAVHLAGALGRPVWVALSLVPDWRFLLHREDSPWYPTMRLFRQARWGDWDEVFQRIADCLRHNVKTEADS